jgi:flagellar hook-associated protein 1 FlgK
MSSLFTSLFATAGAIKAYNRALDVIQNNVSNASTPGYAAARISTEALPFDPDSGIVGGVTTGPIESSRDDFVEQTVWLQQNSVGEFTQKSQSLASIEQILGVTADASLPASMNALFQSFSALSTAPNDPVLRQQVLDNADQLAGSFHAASNNLAAESAGTDQAISSTVDQINQIVGQIRNYNQAVGAGAVTHQDGGADAQVYADLENLSQLVDFTAGRDSNGEFEISLGSGQAPLLRGTRQFQLSPDFSQTSTEIRTPSGEAVSSQIGSGKLAALLDMKNNRIASFSSDLDRLAAGLASQVNDNLAAGVDAGGNPGQALFAYDPSAAASTLAVTAITTSGIAAASPGAPGGSGNAANLAALASQPLIEGTTFTQFYSALASRVGQQKSSADQSQQLHQQLVGQAQSIREQTSGVSLDEEATRLIEFQRAYQASAQLLSVLSQLTGTMINMLQG